MPNCRILSTDAKQQNITAQNESRFESGSESGKSNNQIVYALMFDNDTARNTSHTIGGIVLKETVCCVGGKVKH